MELKDFPTNPKIDPDPRYGDWKYAFDHLRVDPVVVGNASGERFDHDAVAEVTHFYADSNGEPGTELTLQAVMRLHDGRWAFLDAWNDYTGWGCQDDSVARVAESFEDVVLHGMDAEARRNLSISDPMADEQRPPDQQR
jgi:hypothetical protein